MSLWCPWWSPVGMFFISLGIWVLWGVGISVEGWKETQVCKPSS